MTVKNDNVDQPQIEGREIVSDTPSCDINFFMNADKFSEAMLQQIPELQAVAVIPVWAINMTNIPNGRIRLRSENAPYVNALFNVMQRLAAFGVDLHRDIASQAIVFNQAVHNLSLQVQQKTFELETISQKLDAAQEELAAQTQET